MTIFMPALKTFRRSLLFYFKTGKAGKEKIYRRWPRVGLESSLHPRAWLFPGESGIPLSKGTGRSLTRTQRKRGWEGNLGSIAGVFAFLRAWAPAGAVERQL